MASLKILYRSDETPTKHVIFVHGLDGHAIDTWKSNDETVWPVWIGEDQKSTFVWSVDYDAKKFGNDSMHLVRRGSNIFELLLTISELKDGEIILVGHSFGGLVIKQLLRHASDQRSEREDVSSFLIRVKKIVFLGTPHTGSSLATLSDKARIVLTNSGVTQSLKKNDPHLVELKSWYKNWSANHGVQNLALMEDRPTTFGWGIFKKSIWVVKPDSADPGVKEDPIMVDADHYSICKPDTKESEVYRHVSSFLEKKNEFVSQQERIELKVDVLRGELKNVNRVVTELDYFASTQVFATKILDTELNHQLERIIKYRFFNVFPTIELSIELGRTLLDDGTFAKTSVQLRSRACAWIARLLCFEQSESVLVSDLIEKSKQLYSLDEQNIAYAFINSNEENVQECVANLLKNTSPERLSAAFMLLKKYDSNVALSWFEDAKISIRELFVDGQISLLILLINQQRWDQALTEVNQLIHEDLLSTTTLKYFTALILLCSSVVESARNQLLVGVPILARNFPFKSDIDSISLRKRAVCLFRTVANELEGNDLEDVRKVASDYALWIELNDRESFSSAKVTVENIFSNEKNIDDAIRILPLIGDLDLDFSLVESEINKRITITLGNDYHAVIAKYALLLRIGEPRKLVKEIEKNMDIFLKYIELNSIYGLKIQAYSFMGKDELAQKECKALYEEGKLTKEQYDYFVSIVGLEENADKASILEDKYNQSYSLEDLSILIASLRRFKDSRLEKYQEKYFILTKNISAAEELISTYNSNGYFDKISSFISENFELIEQSIHLQIHAAWSLYRQGKVHECREMISKYFGKEGGNHHLIDDLEDSLNLCTGDWDALVRNIELAWENRTELSTRELFRKSYLAEAVLPNRARKFVKEAVNKEPNNPEILTSAYTIATNLGLDDKEEVGDWLKKAVELSENDGPIRRISLDEIGDIIGSNKEKPNKAWELFVSGDAPSTLVASILNRTISSFYITPWIVNTNGIKINRKCLIPAYSLNRGEVDINPEIIALDLASIFSLSNIRLLEQTIESFKNVIIPHSTLLSIFNDRKKTAFHQPSQIALAKSLKEDTKSFSIFKYNSVKDIELRAKVNDEAAEFISHAMEEEVDTVRRVCISTPVYVAGSLMREEFDLTPYRECLVSCEQIIKFLYECGMIMQVEAQEMLESLESPLNIDDIDASFVPDSELYIDRLTCQTLHRIGVLSILGESTLKCYISESHDIENQNLIKFEEINNKVISDLDYIRKTLHKYIISGKLKLTAINHKEGHDESHASCVEIVTFSTPIDAIVTDERFLNKFKNIKTGFGDIPTITTWGLLHILHRNNILNDRDLFVTKIKLINRGYIFCKLNENELDQIFDASIYNVNGLVESAELKAIRQNIILIKSSEFIELPRDAEWLISLMSSLSRYLKSIWDRYEDDSKCKAISNWIYHLIDYKTWAECYTNQVGEGFALNADMLRVNSLLHSHDITRVERKKSYHNWLTAEVLDNVKHSNPNLYRQLLINARHMSFEGASKISDKIEGNYHE
ncbi:esterase/lipase family protein [Vibrio parahaemolyticus]|uniref:esterase/lipase family protein n=1 Tax=Vibrio parahaemolyticus TaxID=670 RepID=UPI00062AF5BF|nr:hypothetical protein [Vibrio parahaemolyticus]KKX72286.1 hypothetical protein UF34_02870 [Vibrio parahaemolyticus]